MMTVLRMIWLFMKNQCSDKIANHAW